MAALLDIDFLLLIENQQVAHVLDAFLRIGWIVAVIIGLVLWVSAYRTRDDGTTEYRFAPVFMTTGIVFFGAGVITASKYLSGTPPLFLNRGISESEDKSKVYCNAVLDGSRLQNFAEDYYVVLICVPAAGDRDIMRDDFVHISFAKTITPGNISILSRLTEEQRQEFSRYSATIFRAAAIPKTANKDAYRTLEDIEAMGGVLFPDAPGFGRARGPF